MDSFMFLNKYGYQGLYFCTSVLLQPNKNFTVLTYPAMYRSSTSHTCN